MECLHEDCDGTLEYLEKLEGWVCNECLSDWQTAEVPTENAHAEISGNGSQNVLSLPYSVSVPIKNAFNDELSNHEQLGWGRFAAEQILRTVALPQIAGYLRQDKVSEARLNLLLNRIHVPTFGDWLRLARKFSEKLPVEFKKSEASTPFGQKATEAFERTEKGEGVVEAFYPHGESSGKRGGQFTVIMWLRNKHEAHDAPLRNNQEGHRATKYLKARLSRILDEFSFLEDSRLLLRHNGQLKDLMDEASVDGNAKTTAGENRNLEVVLENSRGEFPLFPLFFRFADELGNGESSRQEPCRLLDKHLPDRLNQYVSPTGLNKRNISNGHEAFRRLSELLDRKQVTAGQVADQVRPEEYRKRAWVQTLRQVKEYKQTKYFPDIYVSRQNLEGRVEEFVSSDETALLVRGRTGSGKTSLLCRTTEYLLGELEGSSRDSDVVLFLPGREFGSDVSRTSIIAKYLERVLGIEHIDGIRGIRKTLKEKLYKGRHEKKKVWLIFDAVNESPLSKRLAREVSQVAAEANENNRVSKESWLRVIASVRSEDLKKLDSSESGELFNADLFDFRPSVNREDNRLTDLEGGQLNTITDSRLRSSEEKQVGLAVDSFSLEEARRAFQAASQKWDVDIDPEWRELPVSLKRSMTHPLRVQYFVRGISSYDDIAEARKHGGVYKVFFGRMTKIFGGPMEKFLEHLELGYSKPEGNPLSRESLADLEERSDFSFESPLDVGFESGLLVRGSKGKTFSIAHDEARAELVRRGLKRKYGLKESLPVDFFEIEDSVFTSGLHEALTDRFINGEVRDWVNLVTYGSFVDQKFAWRRLAVRRAYSSDSVELSDQFFELQKKIDIEDEEKARKFEVGLINFQRKLRRKGGDREGFFSAVRCLRKVLEKAKKYRDELGSINETSFVCNTEVIEFYIEKKEFESAREKLRQQIDRREEIVEKARTLSNRIRLGGGYERLGDVLAELGRLENAHQAYDESLRIHQSIVEERPTESTLWMVANVRRELSELMIEVDCPDDAIHHANQGRSTTRLSLQCGGWSEDDLRNMSTFKKVIGLAKRKLGEFGEAKESLLEALSFQELLIELGEENVQRLKRIANLQESLSQVFEEIGIKAKKEFYRKQSESTRSLYEDVRDKRDA